MTACVQYSYMATGMKNNLEVFSLGLLDDVITRGEHSGNVKAAYTQ